MYDLIGDIHGYATPLKRLLTRLGYAEHDGVWRHPSRRVIFLGDFIDRGPEQLETLRIARGMIDAGQGLAVMGNHEYNAVAWASEDPATPGVPLRRHSARNRGQHQAFLDQVGEGSARHHAWIDWFRSLPLYLDLPGLRVIHACWDPASLTAIAPYLDAERRIRPAAWPALSREGEPGFEALETLIKGLEVVLPAGSEFSDKDGNPRRRVRARWWDLESVTYRQLALVPPEAIAAIPHEPLPADILPGYDAEKPLFVGHYWLSGEPAPLTDHIACLDYSIAARGDAVGGRKLCAYRWDGERELERVRFVWVCE
ncbi:MULTISPECIES: metallophosphoesterase [Modicisalibacter]|uniref:metallophosphoesterase n=1 Tax=Modicisalibacter TaxID=574347 RepID=UPI00100ADD81|nr:MULTISPECIES: metallophosphoesterase [Halomonadaceae]MBZ9558816.1 metallophosphoesterase [Modicisalibacter sp. R2A 31.J]MBZ9575293.1 metallophosphoesterase [Modicisalibacter sp. MOD 31.J]